MFFFFFLQQFPAVVVCTSEMRTALGTFLDFFPPLSDSAPQIPTAPQGKAPVFLHLSEKALCPYTGNLYVLKFWPTVASETRRPTFSRLRHVLTQTAPCFETSVGREWQCDGVFPKIACYFHSLPCEVTVKWLDDVLSGVLCGVWDPFFFFCRSSETSLRKRHRGKKSASRESARRIRPHSALWQFILAIVFHAKSDVSFPALKLKYHFTSGLLP